MSEKGVRTLAVRIDPKLHRRIRVRVAQLGRPWTLSKFVAEALAAKLGKQIEAAD